MTKRLQTIAAMTFMKTLLMLFNFVFWLTGICVLALGIWMEVELYKYMELSTEFSGTISYVLMGTGALIILIGSLACCCTVKGQPVLLYTYAAFLMVVFVIELGAGISGYAYRNKLKKGYYEGLKNSMLVYGKDKEKTGAIDILQSTLHCCGIKNYTDWYTTSWADEHQNLLPPSCCSPQVKTCSALDVNAYSMGCYELVVVFLNSNIGMVAGTALGIAFFQIVGVFLSCCLAKNINKTKYEQMA